MHDEKRLQSASKHSPGHDLEPTLDEGPLGITVPMAIAQAACRQWHQRILDPGGNARLCANMLEEQQAAPWLECTPDLAQAALWITHGTQDEGHDHTLERSIWEREHLD
jgi:hypothetical protein